LQMIDFDRTRLDCQQSEIEISFKQHSTYLTYTENYRLNMHCDTAQRTCGEYN